MLIKKIPKRSIVTYSRELQEVVAFLFSSSHNEENIVTTFEKRFAEYIGIEHAIAVSSGRFALVLILKSLGLKKGDGVILSAYNFSGVPKFLLKEGYHVQFVDAAKHSYQIDVERIEERIDKNTKAIIATHLFGQPCELNRIRSIAQRNNLYIIEDAAHSWGSLYQNKFTATLADAGFFSFSGSKVFNTCFGGMVVTSNKNLAYRIREELKEYDFLPKKELVKGVIKKLVYCLLTKRSVYSLTQYPFALLMSLFNADFLSIYTSIKKTEITEKKFRFSNLQALIGKGQIYFVNELIQRRKQIASFLIQHLDSSISLQACPEHSEPTYYMFPIITKNKLKVFKKLLLKGIDSNLSFCSDCSYLTERNIFPVSQFLSNGVLTINLPFDLSEKEIVQLASCLNRIRNWLY